MGVRWLLQCVVLIVLLCGRVAYSGLVIDSPENGETVIYSRELTVWFNLTSEIPVYALSVQCDCRGGSPVPCNTGENFIAGGDLLSVTLPIAVTRTCKGNTLEIQLIASNATSTEGPIVYQDTVVILLTSNFITTLYLTSASISAFFCLAVIVLFIRFPSLRKFPNNMLFWRVLVDFVIATVLIIFNTRKTSLGDENDACSPILAALLQFGLLSSVLWHLMLVVSFYLGISNPFVKGSKRVPIYHGFVWLVSLTFAVVSFFQHDYREDLQVCWNATEGKSDESPVSSELNLYNWFAVYLWVVLTLVFAIAILIYGIVKMSSSRNKQTLRTRKTALQANGIYVVVHSVFWLVLGTSFFIVNTSDLPLSEDNVGVVIFTLMAGLVGFIDTLVFILVQREALTRAVKTEKSGVKDYKLKEKERFYDISDALRYEFILYSSEGISLSLHQYRAQASLRAELEEAEARHGGNAARRPDHKSTASNGHIQISTAEIPESMRQGMPIHMSAEEEASLLQSRPDSIMEETEAEVKLDADGEAVEESVVHVKEKATDGKNGTDNMNIYKFVAYRPDIFASVRELFGVSDHDFEESMCSDPHKVKQNFSEGKSGSFFFLTADMKYMVKTVNSDEHQVLLGLLPFYLDYMTVNHASSFICRFFGAFSIVMFGIKQHFVVMNNFLQTPAGMKLHQIFDLKGSSVGRHTPQYSAGKRVQGKIGPLKDNDFHQPIQMRYNARKMIAKQLIIDANFLRAAKTIDYSLLIGIHHCRGLHIPSQCLCEDCEKQAGVRAKKSRGKRSSQARRDRAASDLASSSTMADDDGKLHVSQLSLQRSNSESEDDDEIATHPLLYERDVDDDAAYRRENFCSENLGPHVSSQIIGPGIYFFGIIDILQQYNWRKKLELWGKVLCFGHCNDYRGISVTNPKFYSERFIGACMQALDIDKSVFESDYSVRNLARAEALKKRRRFIKKLSQERELKEMQKRSRVLKNTISFSSRQSTIIAAEDHKEKKKSNEEESPSRPISHIVRKRSSGRNISFSASDVELGHVRVQIQPNISSDSDREEEKKEEEEVKVEEASNATPAK